MAEVSNSTLLKITAGALPKGACVVIVRTEWNASIIDKLEEGCTRVLAAQQIEKVKIVTVPGAFEIPFAISQYFETHNRDITSIPASAFIALGTVIRGDTPHFDYVCKAVTDGVLALNLRLPVPVIFGVLTVDNETQAKERIGGKHGHKGEEAAITALKMITLQKSFLEK